MKPQAIDLFAGAGGLSCGFAQIGIDIPFALERDSWAAETYTQNHPKTDLAVGDICKLADDVFLKYRGVDIVMGGPPCQGFSISASNRRKLDDTRNLLYLDFLRAVSIVRPKVALIENVKEISRFRLSDGRLLCEDIKQRFAMLGYESEVMTLNASYFGVPQARLRTFILASREHGRAKEASRELLSLRSRNDDANIQKTNISLWDAISDLPLVEPRVVPEDAVQHYASEPMNLYQSELRMGSTKVYNHVPMRHTPRLVERFRHLIENPDQSSSSLPEELAPRMRGNPDISSGKNYDQNHRRLDPSKPSPTITASFYSSFIHPFQPRNLTVREAARLQSFPDTFIFRGKRTTLSKKLLSRKGIVEDLHLDQFNQVGNAVPPILARALAERIIMMV